jgi:hypothetical protein
MPSGMTLIASTTLGSPNTAIDFSTISGSYRHLYVIGRIRGDENNSTLALRLNNDSGNNYALVQNYTYITSPGTGANRYTIGSTSQFRNNSAHVESVRTANLYGTFELYIMDYASSAYKKSIIFKAAHSLETAQTSISDVYGVWNSTSAVDRITIKGDGGSNLHANSSVHLYGIR